MSSDVISFTASASLAQGVGPHVSVIADGQTIGSTYVQSTSASTYSFNTSLTPGQAHDIQVVYDNDTVINGQDRNLFLNSITVDGQTVSATSQYEVYHATQGPGDIASDGNMYWSGTAEFQLPASMFGSAGNSSTAAAAPATTTASTSGPAYYVATWGNDGSNGSASSPFASLSQAVSAMQSSGIHTTYVEGGTYNLGSTLNLNGADSGMTIAAAPGQNPILNGNDWLGTLVAVNGASGVTIQGLQFENATGAAVTLNGASNSTIAGNLFTNNNEGIQLNGAGGNLISGNEIDNSWSSGVEADNGSNGNTFDSNVVNGTGAIGTAGGGFFLHGANNNTISHNLVENTAGVGIGIENWDSSTINVGNTITGNIVENAMTSWNSTDGGAIYELGRSQVNTQSVISNNEIFGQTQVGSGNQVVGIYLDDMTSGVQITGNIVDNQGTFAIQVHGGSNVTIQNNIMDLGASSGQSWGPSAVELQSENGAMNNVNVGNNIITSTSGDPIAYVSIGGGSPNIGNNLYWDPNSGNAFQNDGDYLGQYGAQYGNPGFVNQGGQNYSFGNNSDASAVGFVAINQSAMGPQSRTAQWFSGSGISA